MSTNHCSVGALEILMWMAHQIQTFKLNAQLSVKRDSKDENGASKEDSQQQNAFLPIVGTGAPVA